MERFALVAACLLLLPACASSKTAAPPPAPPAPPPPAKAPDTVTLDTGETLKGKVVESGAAGVVLEHPVLGRVSLPAGKVKSVAKEGDKPPEPPVAWKSRFEAGLNGSSGNTSTLGFIAGMTSDRKAPLTLTHFESRWFLKDTDHQATENHAYGLVRRDWSLEEGSRTSIFAEGRYDRDQFQEWNQRGTAAAGVAYAFIRREDLTAGFRVGAAATKEWGVDGPNREHHVRPEGLAGVEAKWKIDDRKEFTFQSTYYPDLANLPEYRLLSSAGLSVRLDDKGSATLRAGVEHEYDTHREAPFRRGDVRYFVLLVIEF